MPCEELIVEAMLKHLFIWILGLFGACLVPFAVGFATMNLIGTNKVEYLTDFANVSTTGTLELFFLTGFGCLALAQASRVRSASRTRWLVIATGVFIAGILFLPVLAFILVTHILGLRAVLAEISVPTWPEVAYRIMVIFPILLMSGTSTLLIFSKLEAKYERRRAI